MTTLAYAIQPSDAWYFAELDREHAEEGAKEDFVSKFKDNIARPWFFLNRINEEHAFKVFDSALQAIYESDQKSTAFNRTLLSLWANPYSDEYSKQISNMIGEEIKQIAEKEFEKNPSLFDW